MVQFCLFLFVCFVFNYVLVPLQIAKIAKEKVAKQKEAQKKTTSVLKYPVLQNKVVAAFVDLLGVRPWAFGCERRGVYWGPSVVGRWFQRPRFMGAPGNDADGGFMIKA